MTTFRSLENKNGIQWSSPTNPSSLDEWYSSIRDTDIDSLSVGDICKAVRQRIFVDSVLPYALGIIKDDPLAGDSYDGELLAALSGLSPLDWSGSEAIAHQLSVLLSEECDALNDPDLRNDLAKLTATFESIEKTGQT